MSFGQESLKIGISLNRSGFNTTKLSFPTKLCLRISVADANQHMARMNLRLSFIQFLVYGNDSMWCVFPVAVT